MGLYSELHTPPHTLAHIERTTLWAGSDEKLATGSPPLGRARRRNNLYMLSEDMPDSLQSNGGMVGCGMTSFFP